VTLTLRARLSVIATVVSGLLLAGLSVVSYNVLARWLDADVNTRLTQLVDGLHGYLDLDDEVPSVAFNSSDNDQASFVHEATRYYQIFDGRTGQLLVASPDMSPLGLTLTRGEIQSLLDRPRPVDITTPYGRLRILSNPVTGPGGRLFLLQVAVSLTSMDNALSRYRDLLVIITPLSLLMVALAARWLSGLALEPLSQLAAASREIDVTTLERRLPTRGVGDELDEVARAFNDTLARLQRSIGEMRQFSTALAHELRTPLAALRGEIELSLRAAGSDPARQPSLASQIEEVDRLKRLIDHVLTLARAESGQIPLTFGRVDLGELAASLAEQLEPVATARSITLRCEREGPVIARGDAGWLERALLNLLDNAIKFTPANGHVLLRVSRQGKRARIDVTDTGIGMPSSVAAHVFERFYQADPSRSSPSGGVGLGLSLVQWIVDRHNGSVSVTSQPGQGSTFTLLLPGFDSNLS